MDTETKTILQRLDTQADRQDDMRKQLDTDRRDIDKLVIGQDTITKGQTAIIDQMTDLKEQLRQMVIDTIKEEVPKAVKKAIAKELTTIQLENPRKKIVRKQNWFQKLLSNIKTKWTI